MMVNLELFPQKILRKIKLSPFRAYFYFSGAGGRTRTYDGGTPADLQSAVIATRRLQRLAINNTIGVFIHYNKVCKTLQGLL